MNRGPVKEIHLRNHMYMSIHVITIIPTCIHDDLRPFYTYRWERIQPIIEDSSYRLRPRSAIVGKRTLDRQFTSVTQSSMAILLLRKCGGVIMNNNAKTYQVYSHWCSSSRKAGTPRLPRYPLKWIIEYGNRLTCINFVLCLISISGRYRGR